MSGHGNPTPSLRVSMKLYLPISILYTEKKNLSFGLVYLYPVFVQLHVACLE